MSDNVSNNQDKPESGSNQEEFVPRNAFVEVSNDMHKYKSRLKEAEAKINEFTEREKLKEKEKLESEKKWEDLYKAEKKAREDVESQRTKEHEQWIDSHKINALLHELGGLQKQEYIKHANLKNIEILEDGSIDPNSLKKEVDRFRQEHSVLLKSVKTANIPNEGPKVITSSEPAGFDAMRAQIANILRGQTGV